MSRNWISTDEELHRGDYLMSENGKFKAILQHDGNFVVYAWSPIWASNTVNTEVFRLILQADNNLVLYNRQGGPVWASNTDSDQCCARMRLTMTNEGRLVLHRNGETIWNSGGN